MDPKPEVETLRVGGWVSAMLVLVLLLACVGLWMSTERARDIREHEARMAMHQAAIDKGRAEVEAFIQSLPEHRRDEMRQRIKDESRAP